MCMRPTHVLAGSYAGVGTAVLAHWPLWQVAASALIAAATAPGPDVDQHGWWKRLDRWVPDEWLGHGGPLQHRGITHFWGLPLAVAVLVYLGGAAVPGPWWVVWAGLAGWVSHLFLDFIWGMASPWDHRGPGIPFWPWWGHVGIGLDTGGALESLTRWALSVAWLWPAWIYAAPHIHTAWEATR